MGLPDQIARQRALYGLDVVLILEQHTQCVVDDAFVQLTLVHGQQGICPIQRLGHTRRFEQLDLAQPLHGRYDLKR